MVLTTEQLSEELPEAFEARDRALIDAFEAVENLEAAQMSLNLAEEASAYDVDALASYREVERDAQKEVRRTHHVAERAALELDRLFTQLRLLELMAKIKGA